MARTFNYLIKENNQTIEEFLIALGYPKSILTFLKKHNEDIILNNKQVPTTTVLEKDDKLSIIIEEDVNKDIKPTAIQLDIVYEDEDVLVINKPAYLPVHPSLSNFTLTLANGVMYHYQQTKQNSYYHCITRLDKDTSGLVLIGKNRLAAALLNKQLQNGQIKKVYYGLVSGDCLDHEVINKKIAKGREGIKRIIDEENGEEAISEYFKIKYDASTNISLLKIITYTGRTHQIRVHLSSISHPLIGDKLYNPENQQLDYQGLWVHSISFVHPFSNEQLFFKTNPSGQLGAFYSRFK